MAKKSTPSPAIKGYLPLRVALPPISASHSFATFIYVKEHAQKSQGGGGGGATLFVANAPANGPIRTDLFLRALFEPYGEVQRVTVARDPRKVGSSSSLDGDNAAEIFREAAMMGLDGDVSDAIATHRTRGDGKFAHVVFASGREMKTALKALKREMAEAEDLFAMRLDEERMEELEAETIKLRSADASQESDDDGSHDDEGETAEPLTGIHAVAVEARRKAGRHLSRQKLMDMCNAAMASFETEEAEAERKAKMAASQPDEDGFVTVARNSAPSFGAANDLEEERHHRRKAGKRNRKRKGGSGADAHTDFYRFQRKETRKKDLADLKQRFEEDLAKVKKMKEERAYRPF